MNGTTELARSTEGRTDRFWPDGARTPNGAKFSDEQSVRYTAEAVMEERTLRDVERWKDKIEVRLDNRQVFFLFFGSALTACLLFILGVIVGKRLEARGHASTSPEIEDPLALLDRVASTPAPSRAVGPAAGKAIAATGASASASGSVSAKVPAAAGPVTPPRSLGAPAPKPALTVAPEAKLPVTSAPISKGRFTLQLSSFQERGDAEAFAKRFEFANPYIVVSAIPGKGTWYRVRVGEYTTAKEASTAKDAFEKQHNTIAYVAPK